MKPLIFISPLIFVLLAGCNKAQNQSAQNSQEQSANVTSGSPEDGNLAPPVEYTSPSQEFTSGAPTYTTEYSSAPYYSDSQTEEASEPPPPLPDYDQPPAPGEDYIWTPGYWNYADGGYYWVPGAWVLAPYVGALWTPPWWGYDNGAYVFHAGYWAPHVGYYGGIDYGYGYTGRGYYGGYWNHGQFAYNRAATNVDSTAIHNVYDYRVPNNRGPRVSYNGGRGGITAQPTPQELAVTREQHTPPVNAQLHHERDAASNRAQFAARNNVRPAQLAAPRPLNTAYHSPAPPPAAITRPPQRTAPVPARRGEQATRLPETIARPQARPAPAVAQRSLPGPAAPLAPGRQAQNSTEAPPHPARQALPDSIPAARPAPVPARPEARPAPIQRSEARPVAPPRPVPQARPEPVPIAPPRGAPVARAESRPAPRPLPEARPAAPPRPAPEARPVAPPRPAPQARPAAPPRPAQEARPVAPPRPAPQARPAPAPRPAPAARRPEPQKDERR